MGNTTVTKNGNIVVVKSSDPTFNNTVVVNQTATSVTTVNAIGPRGPQGPKGDAGDFDVTSVVTTSSFNLFTSSYKIDSSSFIDRINNITFDTSSFVKNSQTSSFITSNQTSSFVLNSVTSSMLLPYVLNSNTSSFVQNNQTSSFVTNSQTSSFVTNSVTSSMLSPYVLNSRTGSFISNSQTSSMSVGTASYTPNAVVNGTVSVNTLTFIKGDGTTFNLTVAGGGGGGGIADQLAIKEITDDATYYITFVDSNNPEFIPEFVYTNTGLIYNLGSNTLFADNFTGDLRGNASTANNALFAITASYANTASYAPNYVLNSVTSSMLAPYVLTSVTSSMTVASSSWATNALTSSRVIITNTTTGPIYYPTFVSESSGDRAIRTNSSSLSYNANTNTLTVTSSWASTAITASYAFNADNFTIRGNLIVSGTTTIGDANTDSITLNAATMSLGSGTGILNIDSNTFVVDGANNRVGVLKNNPSSTLDINGTTIVTGSVLGNITALSISSNTASLNLSAGNFFTLQLVGGTNTYINPTNISAGQTTNVLISTVGSATVSFPSSVKQPTQSAYVPTTTTGKDVITLVSFDSTTLYLAYVNNLV